MKNYKSINDLFEELKNTNYLVMRNYEEFENENFIIDHPDIDLLCEDVKDITSILDCKPKGKRDDKLHYVVSIKNRLVPIDIRHIGDNYFDKTWQHNVLLRKTSHNNFYVMNKTDYFYTLLYHACIHKKEFKKDYIEKLISLGNECKISFDFKDRYNTLNNYLRNNGYFYVYPKAKTTSAYLENVDKRLIKESLLHWLIGRLRKLWHYIKRNKNNG